MRNTRTIVGEIWDKYRVHTGLIQGKCYGSTGEILINIKIIIIMNMILIIIQEYFPIPNRARSADLHIPNNEGKEKQTDRQTDRSEV